jgi:hypothetical protein
MVARLAELRDEGRAQRGLISICTAGAMDIGAISSADEP